jgi:hypothetical protein
MTRRDKAADGAGHADFHIIRMSAEGDDGATLGGCDSGHVDLLAGVGRGSL